MSHLSEEINFKYEDSFSVIFFGSPLIDMILPVDDDFLKKYNLEADATYAAENANCSKIFENIAANCSKKIGGSVTNTCRIFRKFSDFPKLIKFFGAVGDDESGDNFKKILLLEGIDAQLQVVNGVATGKVAVLLKDNFRTLVTDLGASRCFSDTFVDWSLLQKTHFVYFSGFFISVSLDTIGEIMKSKVKVAFNIGAPFLCQKYPNKMISLYRRANLVFGNEREFVSLCQIMEIKNTNISESVLTLNKKLGRELQHIAVITRGDQSVILIENSKVCEFSVGPIEDVVDTNGAGDAFVGGFLAAYCSNATTVSSVKKAIEVANLFIQNKCCCK